jgi:hypothetical protein
VSAVEGAAEGGHEEFVAAVRPLADAMGAVLLPPGEAGPDDVVLSWGGAEAVAVRLPQLADSLDHVLAAMERTAGRPLAGLDRKAKQEAVRTLEARGAFAVRHGVETVASALGVSRFTVYNYLNRANENRANENPANAGRVDAGRAEVDPADAGPAGETPAGGKPAGEGPAGEGRRGGRSV